MKACNVIEIVTPKKFILNGLWFGPRRPKQVVIWVHGLGSSAFSKLDIVERLVDKHTAVITFNNRGHDKVASVVKTTGARIRGGSAHEVFTDCVDDIQGAVNFARGTGTQAVYLAGHSTGCQKSIYYASKKPRGLPAQAGVRGVIILAPISDYSAEVKAQGRAALMRAEKLAREYVRKGKKHVMLPEDVWSWPWITDAQRFISLYTGDSAEEIFTYWDAKRTPRALHAVKLPVLVLLAEKDEFADRPAKKIAGWFKAHVRAGKSDVRIMSGAPHSFAGSERRVATTMRRWIASL